MRKRAVEGLPETHSQPQQMRLVNAAVVFARQYSDPWRLARLLMQQALPLRKPVELILLLSCKHYIESEVEFTAGFRYVLGDSSTVESTELCRPLAKRTGSSMSWMRGHLESSSCPWSSKKAHMQA